MLQKLIITLVICAGFYSVYLYGTRNSDISLAESVEDAPYGTPADMTASVSDAIAE